MTDETISNFTGIWVPKDIWTDSNLKIMEKFFYAEVIGLSGKQGCYATNKHFMRIFGFQSSRVSQLISNLSKKKYVVVKLFYKQGTKQVIRREIYPIKSYPISKHKTDITSEELKSKNDYERDFKGVWIPKDLWFDKNLSKLQMAMITEIDSLSCGNLGCFASNTHFANFLGCKSARASQLITDLEEKGYVQTKKFYYPDNPKQILKREIYLLKKLNEVLNKLNGVLNKVDAPTYKIKSPYLEKCEEREPSLDNHIDNNTVGEPDGVIPYQSIIDYLNTKTKKSFRSSTLKSRKFITERWNEGFRLDDFKKVIDNKVVNWLNDPNRNIYLRPQTLFGPNFEGYLNEKSNIPGKRVGRHPVVEVGTDWNAPENQAHIPDENKYEKSMEELAALRAKLDAK